ncbi:MAG: hypothetical protein FWC26_00140 [Fibromonadales bacterium]|nr:hypothetical protein [Fibromonadales bacterium]
MKGDGIKNAIIESVTGYRDDTILLGLKYNECQGQGCKVPKVELVGKILHIVEVDDRNELINKAVRVKVDNGLVKQIGNIINNKWVVLYKDFIKGGENA